MSHLRAQCDRAPALNPRFSGENGSGLVPMIAGSVYLLFIGKQQDRLIVDDCGNSRFNIKTEAGNFRRLTDFFREAVSLCPAAPSSHRFRPAR